MDNHSKVLLKKRTLQSLANHIKICGKSQLTLLKCLEKYLMHKFVSNLKPFMN